MTDDKNKLEDSEKEIVTPDTENESDPSDSTPRVFVVGLGQTGLEVVSKIMLHAQIVAMDINPEVPEDLDVFIRKMMAARREDRFQVPHEMMIAFHALALPGHQS